MSGRHQRAHWGSERVGVSKPERAATHRTMRHRANTEMHLAALVDDTEDLVFSQPRHSGVKVTVDTQPVATTRKPIRHWKEPFWKRRNAVARQRVEAQRRLAA